MLPPELIDHIFSFLREDISALKACSKAHTLYSKLAERHLYTDIVVRLFDPPGVFQELYNQFINNPHMLVYPRTLKVIGKMWNIPLVDYSSMLPIISIIPRMVNLFSICLYGLSHPDPANRYSYEEFVSTLRDSLRQSSIKQFCHHLQVWFGSKEEPVSDSRLVQCLESLEITGLYNQDTRFWATHREPRLMSLNNTGIVISFPEFRELLTDCSHSLTSLHINVASFCEGTYTYDASGHLLDYSIDDPVDFPFTLSALMCLKKLSLFAVIGSSSSEDEIEICSSLPAIIRLIKTAPSIQHVILSIYNGVWGIPVIGRLDWSDFSGIRCPRIDIYVSGEGRGSRGSRGSVSDESILNSLQENEVLMDLVDRGVVTLQLGSTDQAS